MRTGVAIRMVVMKRVVMKRAAPARLTAARQGSPPPTAPPTGPPDCWPADAHWGMVSARVNESLISTSPWRSHLVDPVFNVVQYSPLSAPADGAAAKAAAVKTE